MSHGHCGVVVVVVVVVGGGECLLSSGVCLCICYCYLVTHCYFLLYTIINSYQKKKTSIEMTT